MSAARDAVLATMSYAEEWSPRSYDEHMKDCEAELDAYVHEITECLRDAIGRPDYEGESEWVKRYVAGWRDAAKTIDPVKETKPHG